MGVPIRSFCVSERPHEQEQDSVAIEVAPPTSHGGERRHDTFSNQGPDRRTAEEVESMTVAATIPAPVSLSIIVAVTVRHSRGLADRSRYRDCRARSQQGR